MFKIQYLSQHKRHTTIKPGKIQELFRPKIPNKSLTHPTGGFWSIFFYKLSRYLNHTYLSRLDLSKMILGPFENNHFFQAGPPTDTFNFAKKNQTISRKIGRVLQIVVHQFVRKTSAEKNLKSEKNWFPFIPRYAGIRRISTKERN